MIRSACAALAACFCGPVAAHPHIFVDSALRVVVEDGLAVAVELTWTWDDFFSLLIFEDMGLDPDADGVLTPQELVTLRGFDLVEWPPGFEGDLYAWSEGRKIEMGFPEATGISVEAGRIVSSHRRSLPAVPASALELKQYDPTFYVAYSLRDAIASGGCEVRVAPHDPQAAEKVLEKALEETPEDMFAEIQLGEHYADTVRLRCDAS
ncbi:DUF1007 family protein [Thetidibacter halocola]|uniref:DUF1007 family protein n=1 Tax=Thetidibacter halocola TaxID=2827239 RepID=A0A8J7WBS3_9RHOB|nr:DUF1007 family protein [Thetidibacter halocola]MBS0124625.1 DUF1007 family protein [Thetidibacter halocola]